MDSKSRYGNDLITSSYDVRQGVNAKVIGVLRYNNDIREKLVKRNIGMYTPANLDEGIGYISNLYSSETSKPFSLGEDGLLGYTHVLDSDYQRLINEKYNIGGVIQYYNSYLPANNGMRWYNSHDNYLQYVSENFNPKMPDLNYFGKLFQNISSSFSPYLSAEDQMTVQSVLFDFLECDNMKFALLKDRIGTISPDPIRALLGIITTNNNSYHYTKDTSLGIISNQLYAQTLKNASYFNSIRNTRYITPSVYHQLGNKTHTIRYLSSLGDEFVTDSIQSRLNDDFGYDLGVKYIKHLPDISNEQDRVIKDSDDTDILHKNISRNIYNIFSLDNTNSQDKSYYNPGDGTKTIRGVVNPTVKSKIYYSWDEGDNYGIPNIFNNSHYQEGNIGYTDIWDEANEKSILNKTKKLFDSHNEKGIDTIVGRFHTSGGRDLMHNEASLMQTSVTKFGMSHGRNLLSTSAYKTSKANKTNGYSNPYCRVWTYHNQYEKINNLIRPFSDEEIIDISQLQALWWKYGRRKGSAQRLNDNTVLNRNGFVNITPTDDDSGKIDIKKCMFSIENLAWKDIKVDIDNGIKPLSKEQIGPNGGRIMWFPPYDLKFNENVQVNWQPNDFIGRGEKIYTYTNTDRSGTLSFVLLVDHPSIVDVWKKNGATGTIEDDEQSLLRFFAGCDRLDLKDSIEKEQTNDTTTNNDNSTPLTDNNITKDYVFYIFFPNNYAKSEIPGIEDKFEYIYECYESVGNSKLSNPYYGYLWQYPVENEERFKILTERLLTTNYEDLGNYKLNNSLSNGYEDATHTFYEIATGKVLEGKTITNYTVEGFASSHGIEENNKILIERRCDFAREFLKQKLKVDTPNNKNNQVKGSIIDISVEDSQNVSGLSAKKARCARVVLTVQNPDGTRNIENSNTPKESNKNEEDVSLQLSNNIVKSQNNNQRVVSETVVQADKLNDNSEPKRWDAEAQYFSMLKDEDYFTYTRIIDKIKYFTPAYHSITPEGFNARLGFLHQCTRQGSTRAVSDKNTYNSAGNLAFGRPPICVLRIGDFYHTKIIIDSLTINYENGQWDLNPEGIGVQPVYAKIDLNFRFLGGSDLEAPISRLQNAVSFNYYANQSVYDDRADIGIYDTALQKPKISGNPWTPALK